MAEVNKMSEGLIDLAERFADVVDAAQGRGGRKNGNGARWLILPVAGAGVYALATSSSAFARRTRKLMNQAKDRATDLPDADLFGRVKEVTGTEQSASSSSRPTQSTRRKQTRRSGSGQTQRRRKTKASA